jgi:S-DNA-T family DNA segregation ATPase FtsK/SpoIIIE
LVVHLPPGVSYRDFTKRQEFFADATGGAVEIKKHGGAAVMTVLTDNLQRKYPYAWTANGYEKLFLPFPVGYSAAGFIVGDLADYPNLLIAGHPGAGKSNMCHVILTSLLLCRDVRSVVLDFKRVEYGYLEGKALLVEDMARALRVLRAINAELDKRAAHLKKHRAAKNQELKEPLPFIVLLIDELAELHDKDCQELLNRIVRLGRAPGICCVAATQRPSSTLFQKFGDSKAMFAATICFKVRDAVNSHMILDNDRAALIPEIPGRAIYQYDRELEVQTLNLPVSKARKLLADAQVGEVKVWHEPATIKRLPPRQ